MISGIYPGFSAGILYAEEDETTLSGIRKWIQNLRKQGFRIHDFGVPESRIHCLDRADDADLFLIVCTPHMKACDILCSPEIPGIAEKLQARPCISVLIHGTPENAVPGWADAYVMDCRPGSRESGYDLHHMEIPLGKVLRRYELEKLAAIPEEDRTRICMDCISVFRSKKMGRFLFHGKTDEESVRVLCALGKKTPPQIPASPEYIVFEDPTSFLPDSNGNVTVRIARVENRDLNPESAAFGAFHLGEAGSFQIPEKLFYQDRAELVRIASSVLQQLTGSDHGYIEADPEDLHMTDMELWPPLPSEEEIGRNNALYEDMHAMERAVSLMIRGIPVSVPHSGEKGEAFP